MTSLHSVAGALLASRRRALYQVGSKACEMRAPGSSHDCGLPAVGLYESWDFSRRLVCDGHASAARGIGARILTWEDVAPLPRELRHRWTTDRYDGRRQCAKCHVPKPEERGAAGPCEPWAHGIA